MKHYLLFLSIFLTFHKVDAQTPGMWTWMSGDSIGQNTPESLDKFGVKGVFSPDNMIPKLRGACGWSAGNSLFVLGGVYSNSYVGSTEGWSMNAMWEYRIDLNQWAWIKGNDTVLTHAPVYGSQGEPGENNFPGARHSAATWTDLDGNFWLFGGGCKHSDASLKNDLWKYDISTGWWTWIKGPQETNNNSVRGTKGVPNILNNPGARDQSESWTDQYGNLWLFGGRSGMFSQFNDLWRYNIATNTWTWMKGDDECCQEGVYGIMGNSNNTNTPGAREPNRLHWADTLGNLYLFGGFKDILSGYFDDLWKYSIGSNQWTWIGGHQTLNYFGIYASLCDTGNEPKSRVSPAGWTDNDGNFWLWGGQTPLYITFYKGFKQNDLWRYNPYQNKWDWFTGDTTSIDQFQYGIKGVEDFSNIPRARTSALAITDTSGNLWLWGGHGNYDIGYPHLDTCLNDLWRFVPGNVCNDIDDCEASFSLIEDTLVPHHYWLLSEASGLDPISYLWTWGDGSFDTLEYPSHTYDTAGFYTICLYIEDSTGCTDNKCVDYQLLKTEKMNSIVKIDVVDSIPGLQSNITNSEALQSWSVFPNPSSAKVVVNYSIQDAAIINIEVFDLVGNRLYVNVIEVEPGDHSTIINSNKLSNGLYYLKISTSNQSVSQKLVIVK